MTLLKRSGLLIAVLIAVALLFLIVRTASVLLFPPPGVAAVSIGISEALVESLVLVAAVLAVWRLRQFMRPRSHTSHKSS